MIQLLGIYTIRDTPQPYYWDIVFEWESEFARTLNIPLIPVGTRFNKIYKPTLLRKILNRANFYQWRDRVFSRPVGYYLAFHMGPPGVYSFYSARNVIPVIIDFWKDEDLTRFQKIFSKTERLFVTSREVYNYLKDQKIRVSLQHISLSLPDRYLHLQETGRTIDVIQLGRQNETFRMFMREFLKEYPHVNYVFAENNNGQVTMVSNRNGDLGQFKTRDEFISLLRQSRVSLVSAAGLDAESLKRTKGFSPVTPRFLESAACGCKMIGIYPMNDDFIFNGVPAICPLVTTYEEFRTILLRCLSDTVRPDYQKFLMTHVSSAKARELRDKLNTP